VKIFEIGTDNFIYFHKFPPLGAEICENIPGPLKISHREIFIDFHKFTPQGRKFLKISEIFLGNFIDFHKFPLPEISENLKAGVK
jgi:hypothetical protein